MPTNPQTFAQTAAQALNAVMEATVGGISNVAGTNWAYAKDGDMAYDNERIPLDEDTRALVEEALKNGGPYYIKNIDSLLFNDTLISPNGLIELPDDIRLYAVDAITERIEAAIFSVDKGNDRIMRNFLAVREEDGHYSWAYLFRRWGSTSDYKETDTGIELILKIGGNTIASLTIPEMELHEELLEFGTLTDPRDNKTELSLKKSILS